MNQFYQAASINRKISPRAPYQMFYSRILFCFIFENQATPSVQKKTTSFNFIMLIKLVGMYVHDVNKRTR